MIWVDREVKKIKERQLPLEWVDDMKTPSGRIHVGALRGVVIYDLVYKVLKENNIPVKYTYVFDDHDPMDAIPSYLDQKKWQKYAGMQLYQIPSPSSQYKNYAQYYAKEFQSVFESINCHPKIIWASDLYKSGKMNSVIKEILEAAEKIRKIYQRFYKKPKPDDWFPYNVVCEKCQKVGTTQVYRWDGRFVYYRCLSNLVNWATGCGYQGKTSPYDGKGKLPWKLDWAAKWKVIGVTIEGAGKDHMSKGGSYDVASAICREVLNYPPPYPIAYEWFTVGGRKMSSSKGVGSSAKEIAEILPPNVLRFLIVRAPIERAIDFQPEGNTIPNLFDDYDRCLNAYFLKLENQIPSDKPGEVTLDFARIIELSAVKPLPRRRIYLPRFRTIVNLLKTKKNNLVNFFETQKKEKLTTEEKEILEERVRYAKIYLENYQDDFKEKGAKIVGGIISLNKKQKDFLKNLVSNLSLLTVSDRETIQKTIYETIKTSQINSKEAFNAFYIVLTGKTYGPKAADLILDLGIKNIINKIQKI